MFAKIKAGSTSRSYPIFVRDTSSAAGAGLSLAYNASGLVGEYRREGQSSWTAFSLVSGTLGTYASGGWAADGSDAGSYEVGLPDAALAAGAKWVRLRWRGAANMLAVNMFVELDAVDYQDSMRFGMTALPNASASNLGGLLTHGSSIGQILPSGGNVGLKSSAIAAATLDTLALDAIADRVLDYALANGAAGGLGAMLLSLDARIPAALVSGRIDASVGAMAANTLTASALAADAASEVAAATVAAMDATSTALASLVSGQASLASGQSTINTNVLAVGTTASTILGQTGTTGVKVADKAGYSLAGAQAFDNAGTWTGNLTGSVGSVTAPVTVGTNNDKSGYVLGSFGFTVTVGANQDKAGYKLAADGVDAIPIESGVNLRQFASLAGAVLAGLASKSGASRIFKALGAGSGGATRVTATVADGERTAVTLNPPA